MVYAQYMQQVEYPTAMKNKILPLTTMWMNLTKHNFDWKKPNPKKHILHDYDLCKVQEEEKLIYDEKGQNIHYFEENSDYWQEGEKNKTFCCAVSVLYFDLGVAT